MRLKAGVGPAPFEWPVGLRRTRFPRNEMGRRWAACGVSIIGLLALLPPLAIASENWTWIGGGATGSEAPIAVARDPDRGRVALGDDSGVSVWRAGERKRVALTGVRDLAFDQAGLLWIGSDLGLYRWDLKANRRPERRSLAGGEAGNRVLRVSTSEAGLVVATEVEAFWSEKGDSFQALSVGGVFSRVDLAVAAPLPARPSIPGKSTPQRLRVWVLAGDDLHAVTGIPAPNGLRVLDRRRLAGPRPLTDRRPIDLKVGPLGASVVLVFSDQIAWRSTEITSSSGARLEWKVARPALPPGAVMRRIEWAEGRVWLATDHGLLSSDRLDGHFERAGQPLGTSACADVDGGLTSLDLVGIAALCRRGIFEGGRRVGKGASSGLMGERAAGLESSNPSRNKRASLSPLPLMPPLPPLASLRSRALDLAGLSTSRSHALRRGLARRAYWPDLSLRFDAEFDRDRGWDADQAFVSGDTRQLYDQSRDRTRGLSGTVEFEWELGGIAYPDESVDLSRELRQVVSLRDDVSDEIHQLYFARMKIGERILHADFSETETRADLELRARELDAGLDAWTGGWLSIWRLDHFKSPP